MQPGEAGYHRLLSILSVLLDIVKKKIMKIRTKWNSVSVSVYVSQRIQNISIFSKPLSNETRNSISSIASEKPLRLWLERDHRCRLSSTHHTPRIPS